MARHFASWRPTLIPKSAKISATIGTCLLIAAALAALLIAFFFSSPLYRHYYEAHDLSADTGMSTDSGVEAYEVLLDYLSGQRDDITVYEAVDGYTKEVYLPSEELHMADVKVLFQRTAAVSFAFLLAGVVLLGAAFVRTAHGFRTSMVLSGFHHGALINGCILIAVILFALVDFDAFWYRIHTVLFPNNTYWLMDPNVSIMINMFPEGYWFQVIVLSLVVWFLLQIAAELILRRLLVLNAARSQPRGN